MFNSVVKDIFGGLPDVSHNLSHFVVPSGHSRIAFDLDSALLNATRQKGLIPHKPFMDKCLQVFSMSQVHQGKLHSKDRRKLN